MGKRVLDQFDLEAEREGLALRGSFRSVNPVGKKIAKNRKTFGSLNRAIDSKVAKRYLVKD